MDEEPQDELLGQTKQAVAIIAQWLLSSVSSEELDRLRDWVSGERLESELKAGVADVLNRSLGYEAFD